MRVFRRAHGVVAAALFLAVSFSSTASFADSTQVASLEAAAQGQEGCYFGECPEPGATPPSLPDPQPQQQTPWNDPNQQPQQSPWPQTAEVTSICMTPQGWCQMMEFGPVGADCWCADWYGNVATGQTVSEQ